MSIKNILKSLQTISWRSSDVNEHQKTIRIIGHLFFAVYITLAAVYYLERTICFDAAFYSYKILHYRFFDIENGRWGVIFTQLLPWFGILSGCSLKCFLLLYSVSFALWNYLFFLIIIKVYRNFGIALAYLFALVLFYRYSFFYPVSEIHSTVGPLFLALASASALIKSMSGADKSKIILHSFFSLLFVVWLGNIHVLSLVPLCFFFAYLIIDQKFFPKKGWIMYFVFAVCLGYLFYKILSIPKGSYEGSKIIGLDEFKLVMSHPESLNSYHFLKAFFSSYLRWNIVFLVIVLIYMFWRKNYLKALLTIVSFLGVIVLNLAYYTQDNAPLNYQNYYCYLGIIMALPLAKDFLTELSKPFFITSVFIIFSYNYYKMIKSGLLFHDRIRYLERTSDNLRQFKERKFVVCCWNFNWSIVQGDWDFPYESLITSSLENRTDGLTFFSIADISKFDFCTQTEPKCMIGITYLPDWWKTYTDFVKNDYFELKPGLYRKVNLPQDWSFPDTVFSKQNIKIITEESYSVMKNDKRQIEIGIENQSSTSFNSSVTEQKHIWLSYHVYSKKGDLLIQEGDRSVLELDIPPHSSIKNGLTLDLNNISKGEYILEIDIVHEGKRWFEINKRTVLKLF